MIKKTVVSIALIMFAAGAPVAMAQAQDQPKPAETNKDSTEVKKEPEVQQKEKTPGQNQTKKDSVNRARKNEVIPEPGQTPQPAATAPAKVDTVREKPIVVKYYQTTEPQQSDNYYVKKRSRRNDVKTLTGKMNHSGGFGALTFKSSSYLDETLVMAGIRGGWIVNRTLGLGIEGHGIIPTTKYEGLHPVDPLEKVRTLGGYGGMFLELIFFSNEVVHITFPVSGGAGWIGYELTDDEFDPWQSDRMIDEDVFWYVEPGAALEVNIARNFRLNFGVSKRFTQDFQMVNTPNDAFDEMSYNLQLKIGGF